MIRKLPYFSMIGGKVHPSSLYERASPTILYLKQTVELPPLPFLTRTKTVVFDGCNSKHTSDVLKPQNLPSIRNILWMPGDLEMYPLEAAILKRVFTRFHPLVIGPNLVTINVSVKLQDVYNGAFKFQQDNVLEFPEYMQKQLRSILKDLEELEQEKELCFH